jgi:hypothetical protein
MPWCCAISVAFRSGAWCTTLAPKGQAIEGGLLSAPCVAVRDVSVHACVQLCRYFWFWDC